MMGSQAYGIRLLLVLYFYTGVLMPFQATDLENSYMEIEMTTNLNFCDNATLLCKVQPAESITWWSIASENVTEDERHVIEFIEDGDMGILKLTIICISFDDTGNYTCHVSHTWEQEEQTKVALLDFSVPALVSEIKPVRVKIDEQATLICNFTGYPLYNIKWTKVGDTLPIEMSSAEHKLNDTFVMSVLQFDSVGRKDNGTYHCGAVGAQGPLSKVVPLFVREKGGEAFQIQSITSPSSLDRLSARHFPKQIPPTEKKTTPTGVYKICSEKSLKDTGK